MSKKCLFYLGGLVQLHSIPTFSLHDPFVCMHCLPVSLSHTTYQHKRSSTEGHYYVHCIHVVSSLLLLFLFLVGKSFGAFHVVLLIVARGIIKPMRLTFTILQKRIKMYLALVTRAIVLLYLCRKPVVLGGRFVHCINRMDNYTRLDVTLMDFLGWTFFCSLSHLDLSKGSIQMPGRCYGCSFREISQLSLWPLWFKNSSRFTYV